MRSMKLALSLALLAAAAQIAAAQTDAGNPAASLMPPGASPNIASPFTIPGKWKIEYKWKGQLTSSVTSLDGTVYPRNYQWNEDGSDTGEPI